MARRIIRVTKLLEHNPALLSGQLTSVNTLFKDNLSSNTKVPDEDEEKTKITDQTEKSGNQLRQKRVLKAVAIGGTAVVAAPAALILFGFGAGGIVAGTPAAYLMSLYGGSVPAGSILAILQSAGAAGIGAGGNVGIFSTVTFTSTGVMGMGSRVKEKIQQKIDKTK